MPRAIADLEEMSRRLPLTADTDSVFTYAIHALEVTQPEAALTAALLRQPALLQMTGGTTGAPPSIPAGTAEAECWHTLALLHVAGRVADEQSQRALLLAAISGRTAPVPVADAYLAARARTQYEWLGKAMPDFHMVRNTYPAPKAAGRAPAATTKLIVIEREGAVDAAATAGGVDALRTRLQPHTEATLVLTAAPQTPAPIIPQSKLPPIHAVYTNDSLLDGFAVSSGPLFLVVDAAGNLTYLGVGTAAWLNPQMQAEVLLEEGVRRGETAASAEARQGS